MDLVSIIIVVATTVAVGWVTLKLFRKSPEVPVAVQENPSTGQNGSTKSKKQGQVQPDTKKSGKAGKKATQQQPLPKEKFTHAWLVSTLKGHTGPVLDVDLSSNDKLLVTCADDRTVYVWIIKDFVDKDHKSIRVNIPYDHATLVSWSPDSKAFIIACKGEKKLEVFKLGRKPDGSIGNITTRPELQFATNLQSPIELVGLGIACNGKFIMSCSSSGTLELREPKGSVLYRFLTGQMTIVEAKISPCGRFVVVAGHKDIEMYEVKVNPSTGAVQEPTLKWKIVSGKDQAQLSSFAFNTDSSKLAVVKEDGNWLLYDTTGSRVNAETKGCVSDCTKNPKIALSGDARVVIIGTNKSLYIFSAFSGDLLDSIDGIYKESINCVAFSADSRYLITAGDSVVHVFQNVSWVKETVKRLKSQLQDSNVTGSMRKRLASELSSYEEDLKKLDN